MIKLLVDMFKNKDIRGRIFFTLAIFFVYRLGANITAPMVDSTRLIGQFADDSILGMINLLGGGALQEFSIFSMGIGPYITASIIVQLLAMDVVPALTEMTKSGAQGKMKLDRITRYFALVLALLQGYTLTYAFHINYGILSNPGIATYIYVTVVITAGTMFLLWLADRISAFGIGNGISMIIFAGIVSDIPFRFSQAFQTLVDTSSNAAIFGGVLNFSLFVLMYIAIIILVIFMSTAVRKIPIQYTSSSVRKSNQEITFLPLKINSASVIPVIFASAIMTAPVTVLSFFNQGEFFQTLSTILNVSQPIGLSIYIVLIVFFTFFYTNLQVDPEKISDNLSKSGTYIPGIRPGNETKEYVGKVLNRITVLGAIFLSFIAALPYVIPMITNLPNSISVGGTGIIIVVGVAMETVKDLQGRLTQKQYRGFVSR
ncbi:MAG: preprotein translocase subunit SecY [Erysipelotrichia bacterium]|jgi:preprotein translocase subunit SecY|nr:preprotein translocase subunit SecY [Erysipelotrichia bacterium]